MRLVHHGKPRRKYELLGIGPRKNGTNDQYPFQAIAMFSSILFVMLFAAFFFVADIQKPSALQALGQTATSMLPSANLPSKTSADVISPLSIRTLARRIANTHSNNVRFIASQQEP